MAEDFKVMRAEHLRKWNAQRMAESQPGDKSLPILDNSLVLFSAASEAHDEPRSCANCALYNFGRSCMILPKNLRIRKLIWPKEDSAIAKRIEYWPVCGYWVYGTPNYGPAKDCAQIDPTNAGLGWVNAPKVGLEKSGTCCGGRNGGDECDWWITEEADARDADSGFCRVLQTDTSNMDCCACWNDDDWLPWQKAQELLRKEDNDN